jgi:hypothetical protein
VRRPRIKFDWTSVRLLRRVAAVMRATGGSSAAGLEGWNLDETLRLPVTGDRLTRVTCPYKYSFHTSAILILTFL